MKMSSSCTFVVAKVTSHHLFAYICNNKTDISSCPHSNAIMGEVLKNIIYLARRYKLPTLLNLISLVVAFATFYLLMTQIIYQATFNHGIENYKQLYRMENNNVFNNVEQFTNNISRPFANALDSMPGVESYSLIMNTNVEGYEDLYNITFKKGDEEMVFVYTTGNKTAISTLTSKVVDGKIEWDSDTTRGVVIPASIAMKYFGTTRAAGKKMDFIYSGELSTIDVLGVYQDFPKKSELASHIFGNMGSIDIHSLNAQYNCIVKFSSFPKDSSELKTFTDSLKRVIIKNVRYGLQQEGRADEIPDAVQSIEHTSFKFTPLSSSYFEHDSFTTSENGFKAMFYILAMACLLVIILATVNYLNFTLAQSPMRISSLTTRRVLGAYRRHLRWGIVMECVATSVFACLLALVACRFLKMLPITAKLASGNMGLLAHWPLVVLMLAIAVGIGFVAGIYPAVFATSYAPAFALKSKFGLTPWGKKLRMVLLSLQLVVSMMMITYFGILYLQSRFIFDSPYGYDTEQILITKLPNDTKMDPDKIVEQRKKLYQEVSKIPGVEQVSFSINGLGTTDGHAVISASNNTVYGYLHTSHDYMRTVGIRIIEGRDFAESDSSVAIINKATRDKWDWVKLGSKISIGIDEQRKDSATVIGVCENIRYGTTRFKNDQPFCFIFDYRDAQFTFNRLNVRLATGCDKKAIKQQINDLAKEYCEAPNIETAFFESSLESTYKNEFRYINLMLIISAISLIITTIGVVCITLFETENRRKEIGIRKVAGATTGEIIRMFCRQYVGVLGISFVIAAPLSWLIGKASLNTFAEHAEIHWWIFLPSLLFVGCVTMAVLLIQSWRIARENPVNSIKAE